MTGLETTILGLTFALIFTRTDFRAKKFLCVLTVLPIITPPFVIGLALILHLAAQELPPNSSPTCLAGKRPAGLGQRLQRAVDLDFLYHRRRGRRPRQGGDLCNFALIPDHACLHLAAFVAGQKVLRDNHG